MSSFSFLFLPPLPFTLTLHHLHPRRGGYSFAHNPIFWVRCLAFLHQQQAAAAAAGVRPSRAVHAPFGKCNGRAWKSRKKSVSDSSRRQLFVLGLAHNSRSSGFSDLLAVCFVCSEWWWLGAGSAFRPYSARGALWRALCGCEPNRTGLARTNAKNMEEAVS